MSATDRALVKHPQARKAVVKEILAERRRQDGLWGEQNHPSGTGSTKSLLLDVGYMTGDSNSELAGMVKDRVDALARAGQLTYAHICFEEFAEALAEEDEEILRAELVQTAAVAVAWIEAIDRRAS